MTTATTKTTNTAAALYAKLGTIILDNVPVMTNERHCGRKNQAAMTRQLFKSLGLKGISVTTPSYSMASGVDIRVPELDRDDADYMLDGVDYRHESFADMPDAVPAKTASVARRNAVRKVGVMLSIAFPNHDDRSDSQSDYFDSCWSIN